MVDRIDSILVKENLDTLSNAWAGGFNSMQFSEIDLNMDGIMDLFAFDRWGNRITTFINNGTPGKVDYTYAPEYRNKFPELLNWVLLRDYNCDGKKDIFTHVSGGIKVFKNTSSGGNLSFQIVRSFLYSNLPSSWPNDSTNIYVNSTDIPAIEDVDGDGDLDIITFHILGAKMEYHKNTSVETNGNCNTLYFEYKNSCWGHFSEPNDFNNIKLLDTCSSNVPNPERTLQKDYHQQNADKGNKHSGSSVMAMDVDSNQVMDLVLGDISYPNLILLVNGGNSPNTNSSMIVKDTLFPKNHQSSTQVDMDIFPASFYLDVNNDGEKDLLVSPNAYGNSENHESAWYYENLGYTDKPQFANTPQKNFLQDGMIETGGGAFPVLHDYNNDGLLDLFVGNYGYYNNNTKTTDSKIALYENTGTTSKPEFDLITKDFAGLSSINLNIQINEPADNLYPAFGDLDGDGDDDMIVGEFRGTIHYFQNNGGSYSLMQADYQGIDVGNYSTPFIYDLNNDSLLDLIIGNIGGNVHYYENTGTATNPAFSLVTDSLGGIVAQESWEYQGYAQPFIYEDTTGSSVLITGSKHGRIFQYTNIDGNLNGKFNLKDSLFLGINEGYRSSVFGGDLNNDGDMDLVIGNFSGGVALFYGKYDTITNTGQDEVKEGIMGRAIPDFKIFPVPAKNHITISLDEEKPGDYLLTIYSTTGKKLSSGIIKGKRSTTISTATLPSGVYFAEVIRTDTGLRKVKKFIIR